MNEGTTSAHTVDGHPAHTVDGHPALGSAGPQPPPRRGVPSLRPALIVVAIAVGIMLLFGIGAALTGSSPAPRQHRAAVHGATLKAVPAAGVLRPIETTGTPPPDILGALVVPEGSRAVSSTPWKGPTQYTQFNARMELRLGASEGSIIRFYKAELPARAWAISSTGAARGKPGATEVLARKASSDGWYWEVGVVVSPTTFTNGSAAGTAHDTTRFTIDLFQVPDSQ